MSEAWVVVGVWIAMVALLVGLPLLAWRSGRHILAQRLVEERLRSSGFVVDGASWVCEAWGGPVFARLRHVDGLPMLELAGPSLPEGVPGLRARRAAERLVPESLREGLPTGDARFDGEVVVTGATPSALGWLGAHERRAARSAVAKGAVLVHQRWTLRVRCTFDLDIPALGRAIAQASQALLARQPSVPQLLQDPLPGVRACALGLLHDAGSLRAAQIDALARGPFPTVHLALIERGLALMEAWATLGRAGSQRQRARGAVGVARAFRAHGIPMPPEDPAGIVEGLIDALVDPDHGDAAARELGELDWLSLPKELALRFGPEAPQRVHDLRRRLADRHRGAVVGAIALAGEHGGGLSLVADP